MAKPTLSHSNVQTEAATLTISNWNLGWWVKNTETDARCIAVGSSISPQSTYSASNLATSTNYTYKAYSDSTCATEIASTAFLTKPPKGKILTCRQRGHR